MTLHIRSISNGWEVSYPLYRPKGSYDMEEFGRGERAFTFDFEDDKTPVFLDMLKFVSLQMGMTKMFCLGPNGAYDDAAGFSVVTPAPGQ